MPPDCAKTQHLPIGKFNTSSRKHNIQRHYCGGMASALEETYPDMAMTRPKVTIDGNEAAAYVAHQTNEVIAIYPITPSSNMGEWSDQWSSEGKTNIWGSIPTV